MFHSDGEVLALQGFADSYRCSAFDIQFFGFVKYEEGLKIQNNRVDLLLKGLTKKGALFGFEHPLVVSCGKRSTPEDLLWLAKLKPLGFSWSMADRGGRLSVHNPGQLVIYPVFELNEFSLNVKSYCDLLLEVSAKVLIELGLAVEVLSGEGAGVFIGGKKIVSLGIKQARGVVSHGVSLNVNNDLEVFSNLAICGMRNRPLTSLKQEGVFKPVEEIFWLWQNCFLNRIGLSCS